VRNKKGTVSGKNQHAGSTTPKYGQLQKKKSNVSLREGKRQRYKMAEKRIDKISKNTEVSTTELAAIFGLTARRVQQMAQDGTLTTSRRGRFLLCEAIQQYTDFQAKGRTQSNGDLEKEKLAAETSVKKSNAVIEELKVNELQGSMHRAEDVESITTDLIYTFRGMLLALPGRLAVDTAGMSEPAEVSELIRKEVYTIMDDLTQYQYDSQKYKDRVRERMNWESTERTEDYDTDE